jgi:hypothetical protein
MLFAALDGDRATSELAEAADRLEEQLALTKRTLPALDGYSGIHTPLRPLCSPVRVLPLVRCEADNREGLGSTGVPLPAAPTAPRSRVANSIQVERSG